MRRLANLLVYMLFSALIGLNTALLYQAVLDASLLKVGFSGGLLAFVVFLGFDNAS